MTKDSSIEMAIINSTELSVDVKCAMLKALRSQPVESELQYVVDKKEHVSLRSRFSSAGRGLLVARDVSVRVVRHGAMRAVGYNPFAASAADGVQEASKVAKRIAAEVLAEESDAKASKRMELEDAADEVVAEQRATRVRKAVKIVKRGVIEDGLAIVEDGR